MISHRVAVSCLSSISGRLYPRVVEDRVFQFSSLVFDVSVLDYFATCSMGATLCMMPREEILSDVRKGYSKDDMNAAPESSGLPLPQFRTFYVAALTPSLPWSYYRDHASPSFT